MKSSIIERMVRLCVTEKEELKEMLEYISEYEMLHLSKEDFEKRKRVKNVVPLFDRCCAKRANHEQCTRRKKSGSEYCGTHIKGSPHGKMDTSQYNENTPKVEKIEVWSEDIQGILYYIDNSGNVYKAEDIVRNKINPEKIARYIKEGNHYRIPEFESQT